MLTDEGYRKRYWKDFPALQRALEGKPRPPRESDYLPSTWETTVDRIGRLLEIATTAVELRGEVWDVARADTQNAAEHYEGRRQVHDEISLLARELQGISRMFENVSDQVQRLHDIVERTERPETRESTAE